MTAYDPDEAYRQTQSQIYNLQETILNSTKISSGKKTDLEDPKGVAEPTVKSDGNNTAIGTLLNATNAPVTVDSSSVLEFTNDRYGNQRKNLGDLYYHPFKAGSFSSNIVELPYPYNYENLTLPPPFLPAFANDKINSLVTIKITYEDLMNFNNNNPRVQNNELWGCQIYTDDSDPLLVLKHCGFLNENTNNDVKIMRTPGNIDNFDNINGILPPEGTPFDIKVTIIILPCLQAYSSVSQFGITSREWGETLVSQLIEVDSNRINVNETEKSVIQEHDENLFNQQQLATSPHDGLSYAIHNINVITRDTTTKCLQSEPKDIVSNW